MPDTPQKITTKDYTTREAPTWCPGCGDFGILNSLKKALAKSQIAPHNTELIAGIGCGSLIPYWVNSYGVCTLHGRALPFATGARLANADATIIANIGDGDGIGIGAGHFVHFWRRNLDITVIMDNNGVYGLTKGQTSPTAEKGTKTSSTPFGSIEDGVNPAALALMMGATFVGRAYSADPIGLTKILMMAIAHKGAAFVDVLQPCVTFNKVHTYEYYNSRIAKNDLDNPLYDCRRTAIAETMAHGDNGEPIPLGVLFREETPNYMSELPQVAESSLREKELPADGVDAREFLLARS